MIPQRDDSGQALRSVFADVFAEMLLASVHAPQLWPKKRDLQTLRNWFDVELVEIVDDAGRGEILHDDP